VSENQLVIRTGSWKKNADEFLTNYNSSLKFLSCFYIRRFQIAFDLSFYAVVGLRKMLTNSRQVASLKSSIFRDQQPCRCGCWSRNGWWIIDSFFKKLSAKSTDQQRQKFKHPVVKSTHQ
jgi:hypothetical protein